MKFNRNIFFQILSYAVLTAASACMVFPFVWMLLSSFKTSAEVIRFPPTFMPAHFSFTNYLRAFSMAPFARYFFNSIVVMFCSVVCTTVTAILGAFAFSRLRFPGRELLFSFLLTMMMVPFEVLIITNYTIVVKLGLYNTLPALFLPFVSNVLYVYILKNFFDTVSDSLYYSARIDGASNWKYLWRVLVPLAKPSLFTIILLNALSSWNSFVWPLYITSDFRSRTLPYGLQVFTTEAGSFPELLMAASTVILLPMIVLFLFARTYIISGVSRGGLKG